MKKYAVTGTVILLIAVLCVPMALAATRVSSDPTGIDSVTPTGYSSQFSAGSTGKAVDNDISTVFAYTHWNSGSSDETPELTFSFNWNDISDIWIRNGNMTGSDAYYQNARPRNVDLTLKTLNGTYQYSFVMDDAYDPYSNNYSWNSGYQRLELPSTVKDVYEIDVWVKSCYTGSVNKYNVSVTDILFGAPAGSDGYTEPAGSSGSSGRRIVTSNQRLATRSGPGTDYDELGSYFSAGTEVLAISRAWDKRNGIWWIQVEFDYQGTPRRAYTGLKRLNMSADSVPEDSVLYSNAYVNQRCTAYYGPGTSYTRHKGNVAAGTWGTVYAVERGFAQFEFKDGSTKRRVWIPVEYLEY